MTSIPPERLASWAGAITWFPSIPSDTGEQETKRRLLGLAARSAPIRLAEMIVRYTRGQVSRGQPASELQCISLIDDPHLASVWAGLVTELEMALAAPPSPEPVSTGPHGEIRAVAAEGEQRRYLQSAWETMLDTQARSSPEIVEETVSQSIRLATTTTRNIAALGVAVLLRHRPAAWRRLFLFIQDDPDLGRAVAERIASAHGSAFTKEMTASELGELYLWLTQLYVPEGEGRQLGGHFVSPDDGARHWRDDVLATIANRDSDDAVRVLNNLHQRFPLRPIILSNLIRARINRFATAWTPANPQDIQLLLADARRRLVRSTDELASLIAEALIDAADDMHHTGELLWDRMSTPRKEPERWRPKPEAALQSYLAHDLRLRLHGRALAVNREVLVKPTNAYGAGDSTDILIEAVITDHAKHGARAESLRVVVEVKCAFNPNVLTDQRTQLAERYLPEAQAGAGIYAVGWYPPELWDAADRARRSRVSKTTVDTLGSQLVKQAEVLRNEGKNVRSIVLVVPRPAPTTDKRLPAGTT